MVNDTHRDARGAWSQTGDDTAKLSRSTAAGARDAVKAIKDLGAMEAARVRRGPAAGRTMGEPARRRWTVR